MYTDIIVETFESDLQLMGVYILRLYVGTRISGKYTVCGIKTINQQILCNRQSSYISHMNIKKYEK